MGIKKPDIVAKGSFQAKCPDCLIYQQIKESSNKKNPVFSLKYIQKGFGIEECPDEDKIALLKKMAQLSQTTWQDIFQSSRHGTGQEKIDKNSLKVPLPTCVKDDTNLIAIRYKGLAPMVGFRENDVFHILWVDFNFNVYKH